MLWDAIIGTLLANDFPMSFREYLRKKEKYLLC